MKSLKELQAMPMAELSGLIKSLPSNIGNRADRRLLVAAKNKNSGFTLLELLVVVAILAVLGGVAVAALGDKTTQAARGAATAGIADVESKLRTYQALTTSLPSNLDTMVCAEPTATALATPVDLGGASNLPGVGGGMGQNIANKLTVLNLTTGMVTALNNAGIGTLRYGFRNATDSSCDTITGTAIAAPAATVNVDFGAGFGIASPTTYPNTPLQLADIPNRVFDTPVASGSLANRGRGYAVEIGGTSVYLGGAATVPVQVWDRSRNMRVGAQFNDVLVAFGVGNNSTHVTDQTANKTNSQAGFYGDIGRDKYGRYVALVKVATHTTDTTTPTAATLAWTQALSDAATADAKATLVAVVDARGDYLDEEFAEARGQKQ